MKIDNKIFLLSIYVWFLSYTGILAQVVAVEVKPNLFSIGAENDFLLSPSIDPIFTKLQPPTESVIKDLKPCEPAELLLNKAELYIPEDAIPVKERLHLQYLPQGHFVHLLPPEVLNVTAGAGVISLTPSSIVHEGQLFISIAIDEEAFPSWCQPQDIKGLYYNERKQEWKQASLHKWDEEARQATFLTDPFAEFIAGIIQSPEHPTTTAFIQTEIKDFKAPKPDAGIVNIEAPTPNNMGTANLSYPLQLPPGRAGMTPGLTVSYNSNAGNSWMGVGWQLSLPSIGIDTRWGVPRYDEDLETETYLYRGEQLFPVANRKDFVPRADRTFYPRIEGAFSQIIRHGNSPKDYWWEVIEKNGKRSFYGGTPTEKLINQAVLKTRNNEIAQWFLVEERDPNDNFIRYDYVSQKDNGPNGNHRLGYNRYPNQITYTGHGQKKGRFSVRFVRDQQLDEPRRTDSYTSATLGFKQVVASLLRHVEIRMDDQLIRSYEFEYSNGLFNRKLLSKILHKDSAQSVFNTQEMTYFDDTRIDGAFKPLLESKTTHFPSDGLKGPLTSSAIGFQNETSFIGGNRANNYSLGIAVTVGPPGSSFFKKNTGGGHYTFTQTKGFGINTLLDIDGDGRGDKVFVEDGQLIYRPNLGMINDELHFGERMTILSGRVDQFSYSRTRNHSYGGEVNVRGGGFHAYASSSKTKSKTTTPVYFQDFNADGLIDIAFNRIVFFNRLNGQGVPEFIPTSDGTPNPIKEGAPLDEGLATQQNDDTEELTFEEENPLHDGVKVWIAPYSGRGRNLLISGQIELLRDSSLESQAYNSKDGVRVSIEHNGNFFFREVLKEDNSTSFTFNEVVEDFDKGDMFFFRVHSRYDGAYDQTAWDITINYLDENTAAPLKHLDANGNNLFAYRAFDDFLLVAPQELGMPMNGSVRIIGDYQVDALTDTLRLEIERRYKINEEDQEDQIDPLRTLIIPPGVSQSGTLVLDDLLINESDRLVFRAAANSNVGWQAIQWQPIIEYNYSEEEDGSRRDLRDTLGNALWRVPAAINMQMFNHVIKENPELELLNEGDSSDINVSVRYALKQLQPPPPIPLQGYREEGDIFVSVKGPNAFYASMRLNRPRFPAGIWTANLMVPAGLINSDSVFIDIHFSDYDMYQYFEENYKELIAFNGGLTTRFNVYSALPDDLKPLGVLYRQWGQFSYMSEGEMGVKSIDERFVRDALGDYRDANFDYGSDNPDDINEEMDPTRKEVGIMYANMSDSMWQGYDNSLYIGQAIISSSRLGEDNKLVEIDGDGGTGLSAPVKVNRTSSKAKSGGISYSIELPEADALQPNLSASNSTTNSWQSIDIVDLNLDGYPDLTANGITQFTNPQGGRLPKVYEHGYSSHFASSKKSGFTGGGSLQQASLPNTFSNSTSMSFSSNSANLSQNFALGGQASVGVSGFLDRNEDKTDGSWLDVTGDGLPDLVLEDGRIRMNYGYRFGSLENWNDIEVRKGESQTTGASVNLSGVLPSKNKVSGSWTLGVSLSKSNNHSTYGHQDITGDGLNDILTVSEEGHLYVKVNLGQQYTDAILWKENFLLDEGESVSESVNGAFTICINFIFVRLCLNPKGYIGRSVSRPLTKIVDIDGDGYPDLLKSSKDDQLTYTRSSIGKSNLLKTIHGSLGATMTLDYELIPSSYELSSAKWVMSDLSIHDGLTGDGADLQQFRFEYEGGFKHRREREFFGFQKVVMEELDTENDNIVYRKYTYEYANDTYYRKGLLLAEQMEDGTGSKYTTTTQTYELRDPLTGAVLSDDFDDDGESVFPAMRKVEKAYYEGMSNAGITYTTHYNYDQKANITEYLDEGNGTPEDRVKATISYHSLPGVGIFSIPERLDVIDHEGKLMRSRSCSIDDKGNLTQVRQFFENSKSADTDYQYDQYGNIRKVTRPKNLNGERMFYELTYDDEVATYVVTIRDAYGYVSSATYNFVYGLPLETIDLNGQRIIRQYDDKGRLTTLKGPYEQLSGNSYTIAMSYFPDADVPYAICKHYDPENGGDIFTVTFIDGLGRPVQVKKSGEVFTSTQQEDAKVMVVSGKVFFDAFGREIRKHYPTTESMDSMETYNPTKDGTAPTQTTFDVLDRPLLTVLPDDADTRMTYEIEDSPGAGGSPSFQTITLDALNNRTDVYSDVRGRKLATVAYGGPNGAITTRFTYNAVSEMIAVQDDAGNETTYTYDLLGRQTSIDHPVNGLIQLYYDPVGNVKKKVTANIREEIGAEAGITYEYDFERPTAIIYPQNFQNNVRYQYGKPGATFNRAGRVILQEDASGAQEFFYGPLGEVTKTIRTITINPTEIRTYVSESSYDTWNRIQEIRYPDGEIVSYDYNTAGKLVKMQGVRFGEEYSYVDRVSYDKFEKRQFIRFGNGSEQVYKYDPSRQWLVNMTANSPAASKFMDLSYQYDAMANILSMANTAQPSTNQVGGEYDSQYTYDKLYRLTTAQGTWERPGRTESYFDTLRYDNTHNILSKVQNRLRDGQHFSIGNYRQQYEYDGDRPFTPSKIGETTYRYDANGNLLETRADRPSSVREYEWDEENRLKVVLENGYLSRYTYDANGERVIKSHGPVQGQSFNGSDNGFVSHIANYTTYVSPFLVARGDQFTKHYFMEGQRICSKIGQGSFNNNSSKLGNGTLTAGGDDFVRKQRQIQIALLEFYGDSLTPYFPSMPLYYAQPSQTGIAYPNLFPDSIEVNTPVNSIYALPNQPDLSGNSQASFPAWAIESVSGDEVRAGYGIQDSLALPRELLQYFYHSDHLGSTSYITDRNGDISQFATYTPFGESFVEDQSMKLEGGQPYLFNGKELDRETGLYYYGARYYDPTASIWLSVDPLANKYPGWSPYNYTMQNPVKYIDPDGNFVAPALIGAGIGGISGFLGTEGSIRDKFKGGAIGAASGLVGGTVATIAAASFGAGAVGAAIGGALGSLASSGIEGGLQGNYNIDVGSTATNALIGAVTGGLGKLIPQSIGNRISKVDIKGIYSNARQTANALGKTAATANKIARSKIANLKVANKQLGEFATKLGEKISDYVVPVVNEILKNEVNNHERQ